MKISLGVLLGVSILHSICNCNEIMRLRIVICSYYRIQTSSQALYSSPKPFDKKFLHYSEMLQAFARPDRRSQEKMLLSMHSGKHQELADALLRAHAVCSGLDTEQLKRLGFSRIASENGQVISAVADLVDAVRKDVAQITAVRTEV
ncbi:hypothetical protein [Enterobacter huaxiensis]|uniref:Uncharacterized protein n=2 Tax=Enterobacter huaxiensis TaxID=2494702 RepID=A0ABU6ENP7_9ENTR|nr:hypothetical protein [Enterobacter huaxiensis]MEB7542677.1 hypothetical protein [Enterobacter huaxiensis]MEB7582955.1 hypothetical protein [Enterobacter huaxiensis]MEB7663599.1 hypothetical protein [Enterobacter huaxiensis]